MIRSRVFPEKNYKGIYFGNKTMRIALDPSKPILELDHPEFYDVKITDKCFGECPYCYMDSKSGDSHASDIVKKINTFFGGMSENEKPFQVAIGGGEPTMHPDFIKCLEAFDKLDITPNYTTNGMFSDSRSYSKDVIENTSKYCGGVAISCHKHLEKHWRTAVRLFGRYDVKLNLHIIISDKESSNDFRDVFDEFESIIDYFVLLPYGETGRAPKKDVDWDYLVSVMPRDSSKIAFGANFHKNLVANKNLFNVSLYEPESLSKFVDLMDMNIYPSSFHPTPIKKILI